MILSLLFVYLFWAHQALELGLPMTVLGTEYQFDRRRLTVYFLSHRRIDFRELAKDLFSLLVLCLKEQLAI
jgi:cell fate regulator YaaT (PSP1 superfamily)